MLTLYCLIRNAKTHVVLLMMWVGLPHPRLIHIPLKTFQQMAYQFSNLFWRYVVCLILIRKIYLLKICQHNTINTTAIAKNDLSLPCLQWPLTQVFSLNTTRVSISKIIHIKGSNGKFTVLQLGGIIYSGGFHFTSHIMTPGKEVWYHDGIVTGRNCIKKY